MNIEILCTGDEVLTGKIVNSNFSYISQKLEDVGLSVRWGTTVGDDRDTLLAAFRQAGARADAVIVNGGLGPTVDDLSQEIAARAAGVELVLHEEWLKRMEAFFERRARIVGGRDWVRLGAVELGMDCLRRYLHGLPVSERIDFEKV